MKFCNKFVLSYFEIMIKDQLFRISGSQFQKWLFGPENLSGLSRNGPLGGVMRRLSHNIHSILVPRYAGSTLEITIFAFGE